MLSHITGPQKGILIYAISKQTLNFSLTLSTPSCRGVLAPLLSHVSDPYLLVCVCSPSLSAPLRAGMLGVTAISFLGLMKINAAGPGITQTIKGMWHRPPAQ